MAQQNSHGTNPLADAETQLLAVRQSNLTRKLQATVSKSATQIQVDGVELINFSSNDYLNLGSHPRVVAAAQAALAAYGAGSRASRVLSGNLPVHDELEAELAGLKKADAALVFSSGYLANLGVLQVLSRRSDNSHVPIFFDRLSHACVVDGALGAGRHWRAFPHNNTSCLEAQLSRLPRGRSPRALIVTEGVFSMDGDIAPLPELLQLCEVYDALLVVDDAHGTGTMGAEGCGTAAFHGISNSPRLIHVGTLSKALGSQGGFVAGARTVVDLLVNRARTFIFETALAPPCAAAALEALRILRSEQHRVMELQNNASYLRELLGLPSSNTPIIPVIMGEPNRALQVAEALKAAGFLVHAIRPPTVPRGTSRLRITLSSAHTREHIAALANAVLHLSAG